MSRRSIHLVAASLGLSVAGSIAFAEHPRAGGGLQSLSPIDSPVPSSKVDPMPTAGIWVSKYDSTLDGELIPRESPRLELALANDRVIGHYENRWAVGKPNESIFSGEILRGRVPMITLRQEDPDGYTAIYTGRLVSPLRFVGSYLDNTGAAGDWAFELVVESTQEPDPEQPGLSHDEVND